MSIGDDWCFSQSGQCYCFCDAYVNLSLDFENDTLTPWEWDLNGLDPKNYRERVWINESVEWVRVLEKIDYILRHGCSAPSCNGCRIEGGDCLIPIVFSSSDYYLGSKVLPRIRGNITVEDIYFGYWAVETIANVSYEDRHRLSEGSEWTVRYRCLANPYGSRDGNATYLVPLGCSFMCNEMLYVAGDPPSGVNAFDAIDDAMYRLLYEELDVDPKDSFIEEVDINHDGLLDMCFDPDHMWFDAKDELGIQSMWGPGLMRLVVWSG